MMSDEAPIGIRQSRPGEEEALSALVVRVFRHDIAPLYAPEGIAEFLAYASPAGMQNRQARDHVVLVAVQEGALVGMIEIRGHRHVALLFVEPARQREGIGRALLWEALQRCRAEPSPAIEITVNSSPNAVEAYRRLGFQATGELQVKNGIAFVPMSLQVGSTDGAQHVP